MNGLMIAVIAVMLVSILLGYFRGLLLTVYSMVCWIIAFVLITCLTPYATDLLSPLLPEGVPTEGIISLIILIVVFIALKAVGTAIGIIGSTVPILSTLNKLGGLAIGLVRGLLMVWMVFALILLASETQTGTDLIAMIYQNDILIQLYEQNPIGPLVWSLAL